MFEEMQLNVTRRRVADTLAGLAAVGVFVVGGLTYLDEDGVLAPESTTTVTKETASSTKTTTVTKPNGKKTTTVEETGATGDEPAETTTTTEEGERTFTERILGDGGTVVLQIAALLLAAFIVGAAVQRVILGNYRFKFANFELADVVDESAEGIKKLSARVDEEIKRIEGERDADEANLKDRLATAYERIALIEKKLAK